MRTPDSFHIEPAVLLIVLLAALAGAAGMRWASARLEHRARVRRAARGAHGERAAAQLLAAAGYYVLGRQVRQKWSVLADGEEIHFDLIADYLVEGHGARWIAEVKTGERSLDLRYGPTRRQLLEYRQAFAVEGVILVDAEGKRLRHVRFRQSAEPRFGALRRLAWLGAGFVSGALLGALGAR